MAFLTFLLPLPSSVKLLKLPIISTIHIAKTGYFTHFNVFIMASLEVTILRSCYAVSYIYIHLFILHGYITNSQYDQLPVGLIAQLVEHCTGIAEVKGSNPVQAWIFFRLSFRSCLSCVVTARVFFYLKIDILGCIQQDGLGPGG